MIFGRLRRPSSGCRHLLPASGEKRSSSPLSPIAGFAEEAKSKRTAFFFSPFTGRSARQGDEGRHERRTALQLT